MFQETTVTPDAACYQSVMNGCAKVGDVDGAASWFDRMLAAGVSPSLTAYNIMIRSTAKRGLHRAEDWFQRLSAEGHTPDVITWTALIEACGSSSPADAEKYFRRMVGSGVVPDEFALKTLRRATPECDALCAELGVNVRSGGPPGSTPGRATPAGVEAKVPP